MVYLGKVQTGASYKRIIAVFLILAVFLVLFIGYATLSQATIYITPIISEKDIQLPVIVNINADEIRFADHTLPGQILSDEREIQDRFPVPTQDVPAFAKGTVTLVNNRPTEQPLVKGSHLRAESAVDEQGNPVYFLLDDRVVVPGNGTAQATVTAESKGAASNIAPGKLILDRLNPSAWDVVYATASEPFSGGVVKGTIMTEDVYNTSITALRDRVQQEILAKMNSTLPSDSQVSPQTSVIDILESQTSVPFGETADSFDLTMTVRVTAFSFSQNNLLALAVDGFGDMETENEEYHSFKEESLTMTVKDVDIQGGLAHVIIGLTGIFTTNITQKAFDADALSGMSGDEVLAYYGGLENIQGVRVEFWPFWVKRVPTWTHNIHIEIEK